MAALASLKAELQRAHAPVVMCIAAPGAEAACAKNGLTFAELLRPLGSSALKELNGTVGVPVRTPAEHPLRLHSWRLRFHAAETMFQPAPEDVDAHMAALLAVAAEGAASSEVPHLQDLVSSTVRGEATPWFRAYRREYLRLLQFGEHEALDHPVACVLALPADHEGDLVAGFASLWRHSALPPLMQAGVMEAACVLRHYVVLHDASAAGAQELVAAQERLRLAAPALGGTCQVLVINSGSGGGAPSGPRFWEDVLQPCLPRGGGGEAAGRLPAPQGGRGAWLSEGDLAGLAAFVHELAVRGVIPHMEARLRALNAQVTANRKGLKNQLKSLLWRKPGGSGSSLDGGGSGPGTPSAGGATGAAASYAAGSVEAAMRQLGDLALQLGDYDTAASTLHLLAADTKADRAYKAYAGVQEALGAAAVLAGGPPSEAAACYKEALHRYSQLAQANPRNREGVRYATRAALLLSQYLRAVGQHSEANWALMKAHFQEENLRAGLLLEQAAYCLLSLSPPHIRKFAFHLVLAGLRYNMCGQKGLAQRAYRQVLGVYSGRRWALIEEHLQDVLGRQALEAGDPQGAALHFMSMLACPHNTPHCQRLYLAQFEEALHAAEAQLGFPLVLDLPLPVISCERVGVQHDGQACYSGVEARQVAEEAWRALDAALNPVQEAPPTSSWLDGDSRAARLNEAGDAAARCCCVGEAVGLDVELHNPLQLDLSIGRMRLVCAWEPATSTASGVRSPSGSLQGGAGAQDDAACQGFQVHEESVTLHGGERMVVHLRVVPLRPGRLQVQGVAWLLNGVAHGQAAFRIPRLRPRKPGSSSSSSSKVMLEADSRAPGGVDFQVLPPMPRLEVAVSGLPPTLLAGEVVHCTMRLRNSGAMTLQHLSMAVAAGAGVHLEGARSDAMEAAPTAEAHLGSADSPRAGSSSDGGGSGSSIEVAASFRQGVEVFTLPSARLGVGQELVLPVWFRAPHAGPAHFALAWRYEPLVRLDALASRTVRFARLVEALPSLHLAACLAAGLPGCAAGGCLLQAHLHNLASDALVVTGLDCHSSTWQICRPDVTGEGSMQIAPDVSAALHRHLAPVGKAGAHGAAAAGRGGGLAAPEVALLKASRHAAAAALAAPKHLQPAALAQQQSLLRRRQLQQAVEEEGSLDVVVRWQTTGRDGPQPRRGFTCLHSLRLHMAPPIDARLHGAADLAHDFGSLPVCVVPVTLWLWNTMAAPAAVCIELGKLPDGHLAPMGTPTWAPSPAPIPAATAAVGALPAQPAAMSRSASTLSSSSSAPLAALPVGALPPVQQYAWCGRTRVTLPAVPAGQMIRVPLQVSAMQPGKLVLSDCFVSWHFPGPPHIAGSCVVLPHHCLVHQS